jgi:L-alanine-DL-glutamate epimerase-like enolase superfamily enzyme
MADESCCDQFDAERLIEIGACDLINLKLGKSGGIFKALKIIKLAESAGIDIQIGGFLESRLGFTAAAHLAHCSENVKHIDFDTPLMFSHDPISGGIQYGSHGEITLPTGVGLGASIDNSFLESLEKVAIF